MPTQKKGDVHYSNPVTYRHRMQITGMLRLNNAEFHLRSCASFRKQSVIILERCFILNFDSSSIYFVILGVTSDREGQVERSCKFVIEPSSSIKCCETIECPNN
jgi:hypothetical protein